jgi:hypothetical protein
MLDALVGRYGLRAIVSVFPDVSDDDGSIRWLLTIDGEDVPDARVRIGPVAERSGWSAATLVAGGDEVQMMRWSDAQYPNGPSGIMRTLRELARPSF